MTVKTLANSWKFGVRCRIVVWVLYPLSKIVGDGAEGRNEVPAR
jgi:hypothetical protein